MRFNLLGCPMDVVSLDETADLIRRAVLEDKRLHLFTANVDFVMRARKDPDYRAALWRGDLVVPDGVPLLWAARALGRPLRGRVNGTDLVWRCARISAETGAGLALVGARDEIREKAAQILRDYAPGAVIHPIPTPFPLDDRATVDVTARIRAVQAKIVLLAVFAPLKELWIIRNLARTGANVGIGVGSAFDQVSGDKPRAPLWMQQHGLEWFHRMLQDPRRLVKRYLIDDSPFFLHLGVEILRRRFKGD